MSEQRYDIVDAADDICREAYNFALFGLKAFYKVSNLEALKQSFDAYSLSKFSQSVEFFQYEHDKIDDKKRKEFYEDLKYNEQNLAYLYSMFEKARTATFSIHMRILARLSALLIENKRLNYYESSLLSNINTLNEEDFRIFKKVVNENITNDSNIEYDSKIYDEISSLYKFQNIGILSHAKGSIVVFSGDKWGITFSLNTYSRELHDILVEIFEE